MPRGRTLEETEKMYATAIKQAEKALERAQGASVAGLVGTWEEYLVLQVAIGLLDTLRRLSARKHEDRKISNELVCRLEGAAHDLSASL